MSLAVCPMCHRANRNTAKECGDCGYEFGQSIDALRSMLKTQLTNSRATFWVLAVTELALAAVVALGVIYGFVIFPLIPFVFVTYQLASAAKKISITKHSLKLTEPKQLPKATLLIDRPS
jgi:uncharacterized membrane protein YvbJ